MNLGWIEGFVAVRFSFLVMGWGIWMVAGKIFVRTYT